jgi:hypothetical protein
VSLGCHLIGAAQPVPDTTDQVSSCAGAIKRIATTMPQIDRATKRRFKRFVKRFLNKRFSGDIFHPDETFSVEEWLAETNYPKYRKDELQEVYNNLWNPTDRKNFVVKGFTKDESYPEYKYPRGIYARVDEAKVQLGPFFKKLGDRIFAHPEFIKKIPIVDRPAYIEKMQKLGMKVFATDFSSFEATFSLELMKCCEFLVYDYFLQSHPQRKSLMKLIKKTIGGINQVEFKNFGMNIQARRMSGEMNTSIANGISNLLITFFLLEECGNRNYDAVFEGDDGLFICDRRAPTPADYARLGANIKIDEFNSVSEASFCGLVYDAEIEDNVTNPIECLMSFGYATRQYTRATPKKKLELLNCKALSMLYQYPGCPIISALAKYGLRMTKDIGEYDIMKYCENSYMRDFYYELKNSSHLLVWKEPNFKTRLLVERLYSIPVVLQVRIENYINSLEELVPLDIPEVLNFVHKDCIDYYLNYSSKINPKWTYEQIINFHIFQRFPRPLYLDSNTVINV